MRVHGFSYLRVNFFHSSVFFKFLIFASNPSNTLQYIVISVIGFGGLANIVKINNVNSEINHFL